MHRREGRGCRGGRNDRPVDVSPDRERGPVGRHRHSPEVDESFHRCSIAGQDVIRQRKRPANSGGRGAQSVQVSGRPTMGPGGLVDQSRQTVDITGPVGIRMSEIVRDDVARTPDCSIPVGVKAVRCTVDTDDVVHDAHLRIGRERGLQSDARAISLVVSAEDGVAVDPQATHLPGNAGAVVVGRHHSGALPKVRPLPAMTLLRIVALALFCAEMTDTP